MPRSYVPVFAGIIKSNNLLNINNLSRPAENQFSVSLKHININLKGGEILGIAGIAGNGQYELMQALTGEFIVNKKNTIVKSDIPPNTLRLIEDAENTIKSKLKSE